MQTSVSVIVMPVCVFQYCAMRRRFCLGRRRFFSVAVDNVVRGFSQSGFCSFFVWIDGWLVLFVFGVVGSAHFSGL